MGRESVETTKTFNKGKKNEKTMKVTLFPWEKLDQLVAVQKAFKL
jgi:S-adenosylmethionine synthetase